MCINLRLFDFNYCEFSLFVDMELLHYKGYCYCRPLEIRKGHCFAIIDTLSVNRCF